MTLGEVTKEVLWIKNTMSKLNLEVPLPMAIHEDNNGYLSLSKNLVHHSRDKHIDIRHHFLEIIMCSVHVSFLDLFRVSA